MHHKAHIGLIDTHAEGYGCADDMGLVIAPVFLVSSARLVIKPSMIWLRPDAFLVQAFRHIFATLLTEAVNDPRFVPVLCLDKVDNFLLVSLLLWTHFVSQIWPIETLHK